MNTRLLLTLLTATSLAATAHAHGGVYRGPGEVSPPSSSSGTGTSGGTSAGGAVTPGGSGAGGTALPGAIGGPGAGGPAAAGIGTVGAGPAGVPIGDDLTLGVLLGVPEGLVLRLKDAVHDTGVVKFSDDYFMGAGTRAGIDTLRPARSQALGEIVPALHRALESTEQRDITSSCLVALAKVGLEDPRYHQLLPVLRSRLSSHDQEIRETAALSLGISQRSAAIPDLVAIATDSERGRALCGRSQVDDRTRAFATYGLGLVAWASRNAGIKRVVFDALRGLLADDSIPGMAIHVAAINALGLLRPELAGERGPALRRDVLDALGAFLDRDLGVGRQLVQAHVPTAAAALLAAETDGNVRTAWARRLVALLAPMTAGDGRLNRVMLQSAALGLGGIAQPHEPGAADAWISEALIDGYGRRRDAQAGYFALTALGAIGGSLNRAFLLKELAEGTKALEKPWAALALGILEHHRLLAAGLGARDDPEIAAAILRQVDQVKNPDTLGAFAVALGLCRAVGSAPHLRELLRENRHQDEFAGYLCIGLALMDDRGSMELIRDIVASSARRPQLLLQAAVALGRLGDKTAAVLLIDQMTAAGQNLAVLSSLSFAVGQIGDRRTVEPLIAMVEDEGRTDLARAFAVVALGGVADKESEPWNAKIGRQVNYRAAVETLTNQASGILDIL